MLNSLEDKRTNSAVEMPEQSIPESLHIWLLRERAMGRITIGVSIKGLGLGSQCDSAQCCLDERLHRYLVPQA